jgi:hypothetical protein
VEFCQAAPVEWLHYFFFKSVLGKLINQ